jgi:hypothetical protein
MGDWRRLGSVPADRLRAARQAAHHAAQVFWAMGNALLEPRPDDSHTAFAWDGRGDRFLGGSSPSGVRAALTPRDGTVHVLGARDESLGALPLAGKTLREALDGLGNALRAAGVPARAIRTPDYGLPAHPDPGGRFAAPGAGRWHTEGWFGAVLEAERVTELSGAGAQQERVREFVGAASASARALLAGREEGP